MEDICGTCGNKRGLHSHDGDLCPMVLGSPEVREYGNTSFRETDQLFLNSSNIKQPATLGQIRMRVGADLQPTEKILLIVKNLQEMGASMIDLCESSKKEILASDQSQLTKNETARLFSLAQTAYEEASGWAIKAITFVTPV